MACGGGGGKPVGGSSQQSSYIVQQKKASDYANPQTFEVFETEKISQVFSLKSGSFRLELSNNQLSMYGTKVKSRQGGLVELNVVDSSFVYTPPEDFAGQDEFTYTITPYNRSAEDIVAEMTVTILVKPVNNKPRSRLLSEKRDFSPGQTLELSVFRDLQSDQVFEPNDTTVVTLDGVKQSFQAQAGSIHVLIGNVTRAGAARLNLSQKINGEVVSKDYMVNIVLPTENYDIYIGTPDLKGAVIAVIIDQNEQSNFSNRWRSDVLAQFSLEPLQVIYRKYINVVFITKPVPFKFAFNKQSFLGEELHRFIQSVLSRDAIVVGIGADVDGGWASGSTIAINAELGFTVFVHELGHAVAHMADEYEVGRPPVCDYIPNPNMSNQYTVDTVPWRHWIEDKNNIPGITQEKNGVGIFSGAICLNAYRPLYNSIMRVGNITGPVYDEAWGLSLYEKMDILGGVSASLKNTHRLLQVNYAFDQDLTDIEWAINGEVKKEWKNLIQIDVDEALLVADQYEISARLVDKTGTIRNPDAYISFNTTDGKNNTFERKWDFTKGKSVEASSAEIKKGINPLMFFNKKIDACPQFLHK